MKASNRSGSNEFHRRILRRPTSAALVSVVMHLVLGVLAWNALQMPGMFDQLVQRDQQAKPAEEKVEFVVITPPRAESAFAPATRRTPPTRAPQAARPATVPLVAPTEVPTTLPAPTVSADTARLIGPLRGGTGVTRGVQPNYEDPRVWTSDPTFYYAPKTAEERLDSALLATLMRHVDSVASITHVPNKFERGDWTVEGKDGQKYGIDQQYIHIGRFRIPSAILALLPTPYMQANPISMDRNRNMAYMSADIQYHAQAQMNEDQFRKAVQGIRDRKERERRNPRVSANSAGPLTSPGERPPEK